MPRTRCNRTRRSRPTRRSADDDQGHAKKAAATDSVITRLMNLGAIVEHQEPEKAE
jgi:hypothetical protein